MEYIFDPEVIHEIVKKGVGLPREQMFDVVQKELGKRYPGLIAKKRNWIFNVAGGVMGMLTVLYGSLREYLLFFGTPIGSEGFSGRFDADMCEFILEGELQTYTEGQFEPTICRAGDMHTHGRSQTRGVCIKPQTWMLEYARGRIELTLPFGVIADTLSSTLDWKGAGAQIRDYGVMAVRELVKESMKELSARELEELSSIHKILREFIKDSMGRGEVIEGD